MTIQNQPPITALFGGACGGTGATKWGHHMKLTAITLQQKSEWMQHFEAEKTKALALKAEIDRLDREINQMVYTLYGLTPDEIAIVEGA